MQKAELKLDDRLPPVKSLQPHNIGTSDALAGTHRRDREYTTMTRSKN